MKYLKKYNESLGFDLKQGNEGYGIVLNHTHGEEILNFLETKFGTNDKPLKKYVDKKDCDGYEPSNAYYGDIDDWRKWISFSTTYIEWLTVWIHQDIF